MDAGKLRADITRALGDNVHRPYLHGVVRQLMAIAEKHADELADDAVAAVRGSRRRHRAGDEPMPGGEWQRPSAPVVIHVDGLLTEQDAERITERIGAHLKGALRVPDSRRWVLVKGYRDSGTIDGVYGPYAEEYADWLLAGLLEYHSSNWTKVKLSTGPEAPGAPDA